MRLRSTVCAATVLRQCPPFFDPVASAVALETLRINDEIDFLDRVSAIEPVFPCAFEALTDRLTYVAHTHTAAIGIAVSC
jgi:adenosylmethionine-8-amino-7-oxononanoate aminotransferase